MSESNQLRVQPKRNDTVFPVQTKFAVERRPGSRSPWQIVKGPDGEPAIFGTEPEAEAWLVVCRCEQRTKGARQSFAQVFLSARQQESPPLTATPNGAAPEAAVEVMGATTASEAPCLAPAYTG